MQPNPCVTAPAMENFFYNGIAGEHTLEEWVGLARYPDYDPVEIDGIYDGIHNIRHA